MQATTLVKMKCYLQRTKHFFENGQIRLVSENWIIKVTYKDAFIDFMLKERLDVSDKKAYRRLVYFCFNTYFEYEWWGKPMTSEEIGTLLDLSDWQVRRILNKIYKKCKKYGKPILYEK